MSVSPHPLMGVTARRLGIGLAGVAAVCALAAAAHPASAATPGRPELQLAIAVVDAPGATPRYATLLCRPGQAVATGFLAAAPEATCRLARSLSGLLLSRPDGDRICTQIYGGPQTAEVRGVIEGRRFRRTFSRRNGCEIADWDRAAPLLGSPLAAPDEQLVSYRRSGGIAGFDDQLSVSRSGLAIHSSRGGQRRVFQLSSGELRALERTLVDADFPTLRPSYLPDVPVADGFSYAITHRDRTVVTADGAIPEPLEPVIATLNQLLSHATAATA